MISPPMGMKRIAVVLVLLAGCGADRAGKEPTTAERARNEGGSDDTRGKKWGGWRYQGERKSCFYVLGGRCFEKESAACSAARCVEPKRCAVEGAGPATVSCR
jgi:hypothetical protein